MCLLDQLRQDLPKALVALDDFPAPFGPARITTLGRGSLMALGAYSVPSAPQSGLNVKPRNRSFGTSNLTVSAA